MSFDFNYHLWITTKKDIERLIKQQNVLKRLEPISQPRITYKIFSELYVLYAELVNKLGYIYHHTFQVQKREVVRELVEAATQRLLELKNELKNLEFSEYVYVDQVLIARKLTPYDLVIWKSPNFLYRRPPEIQNILYENKLFMSDEEKEKLIAEDWRRVRDAIIIIQSQERARRARMYLVAIKYDRKNLKKTFLRKKSFDFTHNAEQAMSVPVKRTIFNADFIKPLDHCRHLKDVETLDTHQGEEIDEEEVRRTQNQAALVIQKAWRAHKKRRQSIQRYIFKQTLYGMKNKRKLLKPNQYTESVLEMYKNELLKKRLDEDFVNLMTSERTRLLQERGPGIMEDISDHIRAWFKEFYDKVGDFHPYPEELKSGTVLVLIDETMTPMEFQEKANEKNLSKEEKKKRAEKLKLQKQKEKEKRRKDKLKEAKRRKKMAAAGIFDIAYHMQSNKSIERIEQAIKQYSTDWMFVDEYLNKTHEAIKDWVTEGELAIIHKELRALVDEFMRVEYELLRQALAADLKKKYKPTKQKKPKQKKGKKKKKVKDLTADRTIESLFYELKEAGIIEQYNTKGFDEFIAEFNFIANDIRDEDRLTILGPAKGDIKNVVQECLLGMGEFTVDKTKSLCLIGPLNNGKKLLCNIIASELDALFMNLSPENTAQFSENLNYFINMVMKVAKAFQPTIIFINNVHRVFWKKIPKELEDMKPRLLQGAITKKILKPIKKTDKVMVIGTSDAPWSAKAKLKKSFQKILLVPKSDYGTSFLLWLELLSQDEALNIEDYVISSLAKVLQNYNSGDITDNVAETLNIRRRMRLKYDSLQPSEFLEYYFKNDIPVFPPEVKILEKFDKWFQKSNKFCKARKKFKNNALKKGSKKK